MGVFKGASVTVTTCYKSMPANVGHKFTKQNNTCRWSHSVFQLIHWGRVTRICVSDLTSIGSDNGLSPGRRQAIIRTNAGILLKISLGTNFSEFIVEILIFSFKKMRLKVSSAKRRSFCLGLNELKYGPQTHLSKIMNKLVTLSVLFWKK